MRGGNNETKMAESYSASKISLMPRQISSFENYIIWWICG